MNFVEGAERLRLYIRETIQQPMVNGLGFLSKSEQQVKLPGLTVAMVLLSANLFFAVGAILKVNAEEAVSGVVPWTMPERVATGFQFTEGPVWHPEGFLLFSDVQGNRIVRWTALNGAETFRQPSGNSNGLTFDRQGRLIACEHANRRISRTELDGKVVTLADRYQGMRLNSPNDIAIKSDGSIYFTDPPYGISPGQQELPYNGVFRISPDGELALLASDFDRPNGLAFSPDEGKLYIADTARGRVRAFDVQDDGTLQGGGVFVQVPNPDGMKVDAKGMLYVASANGLMVFGPEGETFGTIVFPETPANCCFGDQDNKSLFVTARTSLYTVRLNDSNITLDAKQNVTVTWRSFAGRTYSVYKSNDMVAWELAADNVASAVGTVTNWKDPTKPLFYSDVRSRYYRVSEKE